ncbi:MAG: hypothetical protein ACD_4C00190G0003 [uncultured bacterium (gcode 4)]|uniref:Methyltransferase FkbM domain-containing protein n=1 Tax=uncultured bacterium (gcode 4) TaxID=1234023 RepID=K2G984_9BACT|nr:MAG: hypothetical protein ACD_4C00190G0003 [uncultured bacterium (gcode 4)]
MFKKYERALAFEIFILREYRIIDEIILNSKTILDIGWHFWFFSLYVLLIKSWFYNSDELINLDNPEEFVDISTLNDDFCVHFFEPVKEYFLNAKSLLSKFWSNIIFNNYWILNISGDYEIQKPKISSQSSIYNSFLNKDWIKELSKFIRLDEYIENNNIQQIDLLKMDIEWAEFDVLLELNDNLFSKIKVIFIEYHILDETFERKFDELMGKLSKIYNNIKVIQSKYNKDLGYILFKSF